MNKYFFNLFFALAAVVFLSGCGVYSFTGTNIDPRVESISIQNFYDDSGFGPANLSQEFTNDLKDYFQQNTSLAQVRNDGDLQIEGSITSFRYQAIAAQAASTSDPNAGRARMEQLKITVKINFINVYDESQNFTKTFTQIAEYSLDDEDQSQAEPRLVEEINEKIVMDIFNATVASW